MSDTPETDLAIKAGGGDWSPVLRVTSQRLERQRDEAREALQILADYTKNEIKRLRMICQHAHDRLLRGAPDNDLLLILEKSWKEKTK
jgi:hypothetical protein